MPISRSISVLAVALAFVLGACAPSGSPVSPGASGSPGPTSSATPSGSATTDGPLLVVEVHGGECPAGACGSTTVVERDGRLHVTAPEPREVGTVPPIVLDGLIVEIEQADFAALLARPFTDDCPTAYDGQEWIYTFSAPTGPVRVASCEVVIDPDHPLFVAVSTAIAPALGG